MALYAEYCTTSGGNLEERERRNEGIIIGPKVSIDKIQSGIYWSEGNTAWEYRGNASVFLGQEIEIEH